LLQPIVVDVFGSTPPGEGVGSNGFGASGNSYSPGGLFGTPLSPLDASQTGGTTGQSQGGGGGNNYLGPLTGGSSNSAASIYPDNSWDVGDPVVPFMVEG